MSLLHQSYKELARLGLTVFVLAGMSTSTAVTAEPGHLEMFLDDINIASQEGIRREVVQPVKQGAVFPDSQAWDTNPCYVTVIYDEEADLYKAWYQAYNFGRKDALRTPVCYATSRDGRTWDYPSLGLVEFEGSRDNNIVFVGMGFHDLYGAAVIKDSHDSDASRRYKMVYCDFEGERTYGDAGMFTATSPDGIHWTKSERPLLYLAKREDALSDVMDLMYDQRRGKYVVYAKGWADPFPKNRQIVRTQSSDFVHWSTPEVVLRHQHNEDDPQSYGMPVFEYENVYVGLLRSYKDPGTDKIDTQLATSRDGLEWTRVGGGATFIPNGEDGAWDDGMLMSALPVIRKESMEFFYTGWDGTHDGPHETGQRKSSVGVAVSPAGRLAAMRAEGERGTLTTKPFMWSGSDLVLNADVGEGAMRIALLDESGESLSGASFEQSRTTQIDSLHQAVTWEGLDPASLAGRRLCLKFQLSGNARLYGYRFDSE